MQNSTKANSLKVATSKSYPMTKVGNFRTHNGASSYCIQTKSLCQVFKLKITLLISCEFAIWSCFWINVIRWTTALPPHQKVILWIIHGHHATFDIWHWKIHWLVEDQKYHAHGWDAVSNYISRTKTGGVLFIWNFNIESFKVRQGGGLGEAGLREKCLTKPSLMKRYISL